jgi:membrane-bound lytic murein transglycosylase A
MRLRGRLEGRKLMPYFSRDEWSRQEPRRQGAALLWVDDAVDFFFMQVQGSGQIQLTDGSRTRLAYADQNGHPYRSIGKWLVDQGEMKAEQASMAGIKAWAKTNPQRLQEMLNANPSLVFFREMAVVGSGPAGALTVPLTPNQHRRRPAQQLRWALRSGWRPRNPCPASLCASLVLAQDTGGAIRGPVRADFYWGSGARGR